MIDNKPTFIKEMERAHPREIFESAQVVESSYFGIVLVQVSFKVVLLPQHVIDAKLKFSFSGVWSEI